MSTLTRSRSVQVTAAILIACGGVTVWWVQRPGVPEPAAPSAAEASSIAPGPAATTAVPPGPAAVPASTAAAVRSRVQQRLDAIASAYVAGDARAAEAALWPNHAVIRPDGERFDRRELLHAWGEEWAAFANRELGFYVEEVIEDGAKATVVWTILLTADVKDAYGDVHHLMINGKQQATVVKAGDAEMLEGPIEYTVFERTLDGNPWPLD